MRIVDASDRSVYLEGQIYELGGTGAGDGDNAPATVSDVLLSIGRRARFVLSPGEYKYRFHIDIGGGTFKLAVDVDGRDAQCVPTEFDSTVATYNRTLRFLVP